MPDWGLANHLAARKIRALLALAVARKEAEMRKDTMNVQPRWESRNGNGTPPAEFPPPACKVDAQQFCELAVSSRNLIRFDDPAAGLRGLHDVDTGERFVIDEFRLSMYAVTGV